MIVYVILYMLGLILLSLLIILIYKLFFSSWNPQLPSRLLNTNFFYYGHRGAPNLATENTIESFNIAINNSLDGIELDVQLSKDHHLIVYHDEYIHYKGKDVKITSMTLEEIQKIRINNEKIPLLSEVISIIPQNMILNIEIKSYQFDISSKIEKEVVKQLKDLQFNNNVIISSFNPIIIKKIKKLNKNLKTALIWSSESAFYNYKLFSYYAKPDAFHIDYNDCNAKNISWCISKKLPVYVFTVNTNKEIKRLKKYNINGIFTDNPKIKN